MLHCKSFNEGQWQFLYSLRFRGSRRWVWLSYRGFYDTSYRDFPFPYLSSACCGEFVTLEQAFICESHPYNQSLE